MGAMSVSSSGVRLMPDLTFFDGEQFTLGGVGLTAIATPGHCANHLCYGVTGTDVMLSGDHVMGWNSTLVAVPDGSMADYLASLRKVFESTLLAQAGRDTPEATPSG